MVGYDFEYVKNKFIQFEFAYTLDNGNPGDIVYETFNAAAAKVKIKSTVVHPGEAYHLMV